MPGHWGMYIGDGLAVECTPIWDNGAQITAVQNIGTKAGYTAAIGRSTESSVGGIRYHKDR